MRWLDTLNENIKRTVRSWLNITPAQPYAIQINEVMDFELTAIRNRIWYRGDSNEIEQMYSQNPEFADKYKFWASKCTPGMELRKIHTGLPGMMVRTLAAIVLGDMNDFDFTGNESKKNDWDEIAKENRFEELLKEALEETLYIGDGAFKVSIDTGFSEYPILEWYPGERIEIIRRHGRVEEVIFKSPYKANGRQYVLNERYGYGYIVNELYLDGKLAPLASVAGLENVKDWKFDPSVILAIPMQVYKSKKFKGRGGSIFDGKLDNFDALDEAWSQWMDMLRASRARTYIPESYIPRDPYTGELLKPNPFDNRFIMGDTDMSEGARNLITTEQPTIAQDGYSATYCNALDLCLQGIISPSTLGIDVKKLDNAEAQREKEKTTLYTRNAIIEALQEALPKVVKMSINAFNLLNKLPLEDVQVDIPFGEYANPSFEATVQTISQARQSGIMSVEMCVEELYGDTLDEEWKKEEVARLKAEQGIAEVEEPGVNLSVGAFAVNRNGGKDGSRGNEPNIPDEPKGVPGASAGGK